MSKKGENIYKRKDKRWEARYVRERRNDGSIQYGYCYGKTYREVKDKVELCKQQLPHTSSVIGAPPLIRTAAEDWLLLSKTRVKASTFAKYSTTVRNHIQPSLGRYRSNELTPQLLGQFTRELLYGKQLSSKTVRDVLLVLKGIVKRFPHAVEALNTVYPKEVKSEMRVLSREEQQRWLSFLEADNDRCKFGIWLALMTGIRIGEICALRWGDLSLSERLLRIRTTVQRLPDDRPFAEHKTTLVFSTPKSDRSERVIPLTDHVVSRCQQFAVACPDAFVLTGNAARCMEPRALQYRFKQYCAACGFDDVHFHTLRHTFATRCVEAGFDIKSLSEILGHASPKITLERYVHSSLEFKRDQMCNMEKISGF